MKKLLKNVQRYSRNVTYVYILNNIFREMNDLYGILVFILLILKEKHNLLRATMKKYWEELIIVNVGIIMLKA